MEEYAPLNDRTVDGPREGFGALLPNHNRQHEKRYFSTENRDFFGEPKPKSASSTILKNAAQMRFAGSNARPFDQQQVKRISNLMGETLNETTDC